MQVVTEYTYDLLDSQLQIGTSFRILFRAFGELDYGAEVLEVSTAHLKEALSAAGQNDAASGAEDSLPQILLNSLGQLT